MKFILVISALGAASATSGISLRYKGKHCDMQNNGASVDMNCDWTYTTSTFSVSIGTLYSSTTTLRSDVDTLRSDVDVLQTQMTSLQARVARTPGVVSTTLWAGA